MDGLCISKLTMLARGGLVIEFTTQNAIQADTKLVITYQERGHSFNVIEVNVSSENPVNVVKAKGLNLDEVAEISKRTGWC